jgi:hypothetical protein
MAKSAHSAWRMLISPAPMDIQRPLVVVILLERRRW